MMRTVRPVRDRFAVDGLLDEPGPAAGRGKWPHLDRRAKQLTAEYVEFHEPDVSLVITARFAVLDRW